MNTGAISKRYAKALLELVRQTGNGEKVCAQATRLLENPDSAGEPLEDELRRLVLLLRRNGRLPYVKYILRSFIEQYYRQEGLVRARLISAVPAPQLESSLRKALGNAVEGKMIFTTKVDPNLIGGFVLEVDDRVLDASARTHLERIRRRLDELNKRIV